MNLIQNVDPINGSDLAPQCRKEKKNRKENYSRITVIDTPGGMATVKSSIVQDN